MGSRNLGFGSPLHNFDGSVADRARRAPLVPFAVPSTFCGHHTDARLPPCLPPPFAVSFLGIDTPTCCVECLRVQCRGLSDRPRSRSQKPVSFSFLSALANLEKITRCSYFALLQPLMSLCGDPLDTSTGPTPETLRALGWETMSWLYLVMLRLKPYFGELLMAVVSVVPEICFAEWENNFQIINEAAQKGLRKRNHRKTLKSAQQPREGSKHRSKLSLHRRNSRMASTKEVVNDAPSIRDRWECSVRRFAQQSFLLYQNCDKCYFYCRQLLDLAMKQRDQEAHQIPFRHRFPLLFFFPSECFDSEQKEENTMQHRVDRCALVQALDDEWRSGGTSTALSLSRGLLSEMIRSIVALQRNAPNIKRLSPSTQNQLPCYEWSSLDKGVERGTPSTSTSSLSSPSPSISADVEPSSTNMDWKYHLQKALHMVNFATDVFTVNTIETCPNQGEGAVRTNGAGACDSDSMWLRLPFSYAFWLGESLESSSSDERLLFSRSVQSVSSPNDGFCATLESFLFLMTLTHRKDAELSSAGADDTPHKKTDNLLWASIAESTLCLLYHFLEEIVGSSPKGAELYDPEREIFSGPDSEHNTLPGCDGVSLLCTLMKKKCDYRTIRAYACDDAGQEMEQKTGKSLGVAVIDELFAVLQGYADDAIEVGRAQNINRNTGLQVSSLGLVQNACYVLQLLWDNERVVSTLLQLSFADSFAYKPSSIGSERLAIKKTRNRSRRATRQVRECSEALLGHSAEVEDTDTGGSKHSCEGWVSSGLQTILQAETFSSLLLPLMWKCLPDLLSPPLRSVAEDRNPNAESNKTPLAAPQSHDDAGCRNVACSFMSLLCGLTERASHESNVLRECLLDSDATSSEPVDELSATLHALLHSSPYHDKITSFFLSAKHSISVLEAFVTQVYSTVKESQQSDLLIGVLPDNTSSQDPQPPLFGFHEASWKSCVRDIISGLLQSLNGITSTLSNVERIASRSADQKHCDGGDNVVPGQCTLLPRHSPLRVTMILDLCLWSFLNFNSDALVSIDKISLEDDAAEHCAQDKPAVTWDFWRRLAMGSYTVLRLEELRLVMMQRWWNGVCERERHVISAGVRDLPFSLSPLLCGIGSVYHGGCPIPSSHRLMNEWIYFLMDALPLYQVNSCSAAGERKEKCQKSDAGGRNCGGSNLRHSVSNAPAHPGLLPSLHLLVLLSEMTVVEPSFVEKSLSGARGWPTDLPVPHQVKEEVTCFTLAWKGGAALRQLLDHRALQLLSDSLLLYSKSSSFGWQYDAFRRFYVGTCQTRPAGEVLSFKEENPSLSMSLETTLDVLLYWLDVLLEPEPVNASTSEANEFCMTIFSDSVLLDVAAVTVFTVQLQWGSHLAEESIQNVPRKWDRGHWLPDDVDCEEWDSRLIAQVTRCTALLHLVSAVLLSFQRHRSEGTMNSAAPDLHRAHVQSQELYCRMLFNSAAQQDKLEPENSREMPLLSPTSAPGLAWTGSPGVLDWLLAWSHELQGVLCHRLNVPPTEREEYLLPNLPLSVLESSALLRFYQLLHAVSHSRKMLLTSLWKVSLSSTLSERIPEARCTTHKETEVDTTMSFLVESIRTSVSTARCVEDLLCTGPISNQKSNSQAMKRTSKRCECTQLVAKSTLAFLSRFLLPWSSSPRCAYETSHCERQTLYCQWIGSALRQVALLSIPTNSRIPAASQSSFLPEDDTPYSGASHKNKEDEEAVWTFFSALRCVVLSCVLFNRLTSEKESESIMDSEEEVSHEASTLEDFDRKALLRPQIPSLNAISASLCSETLTAGSLLSDEEDLRIPRYISGVDGEEPEKDSTSSQSSKDIQDIEWRSRFKRTRRDIRHGAQRMSVFLQCACQHFFHCGAKDDAARDLFTPSTHAFVSWWGEIQSSDACSSEMESVLLRLMRGSPRDGVNEDRGHSADWTPRWSTHLYFLLLCHSMEFENPNAAKLKNLLRERQWESSGERNSSCTSAHCETAAAPPRNVEPFDLLLHHSLSDHSQTMPLLFLLVESLSETDAHYSSSYRTDNACKIVQDDVEQKNTDVDNNTRETGGNVLHSDADTTEEEGDPVTQRVLEGCTPIDIWCSLLELWMDHYCQMAMRLRCVELCHGSRCDKRGSAVPVEKESFTAGHATDLTGSEENHSTASDTEYDDKGKASASCLPHCHPSCNEGPYEPEYYLLFLLLRIIRFSNEKLIFCSSPKLMREGGDETSESASTTARQRWFLLLCFIQEYILNVLVQLKRSDERGGTIATYLVTCLITHVMLGKKHVCLCPRYLPEANCSSEILFAVPKLDTSYTRQSTSLFTAHCFGALNETWTEMPDEALLPLIKIEKRKIIPRARRLNHELSLRIPKLSSWSSIRHSVSLSLDWWPWVTSEFVFFGASSLSMNGDSSQRIIRSESFVGSSLHQLLLVELLLERICDSGRVEATVRDESNAALTSSSLWVQRTVLGLKDEVQRLSVVLLPMLLRSRSVFSSPFSTFSLDSTADKRNAVWDQVHYSFSTLFAAARILLMATTLLWGAPQRLFWTDEHDASATSQAPIPQCMETINFGVHFLTACRRMAHEVATAMRLDISYHRKRRRVDVPVLKPLDGWLAWEIPQWELVASRIDIFLIQYFSGSSLLDPQHRWYEVPERPEGNEWPHFTSGHFAAGASSCSAAPRHGCKEPISPSTELHHRVCAHHVAAELYEITQPLMVFHHPCEEESRRISRHFATPYSRSFSSLFPFEAGFSRHFVRATCTLQNEVCRAVIFNAVTTLQQLRVGDARSSNNISTIQRDTATSTHFTLLDSGKSLFEMLQEPTSPGDTFSAVNEYYTSKYHRTLFLFCDSQLKQMKSDLKSGSKKRDFASRFNHEEALCCLDITRITLTAWLLAGLLSSTKQRARINQRKALRWDENNSDSFPSEVQFLSQNYLSFIIYFKDLLPLYAKESVEALETVAARLCS